MLNHNTKININQSMGQNVFIHKVEVFKIKYHNHYQTISFQVIKHKCEDKKIKHVKVRIPSPVS